MDATTPDGIFYRVEGNKEPTIIFVHGYGCSHTDWDDQLAGLSSQFRCVSLDTPGHGKSRKAAAPIIPALAAAVNAVKKQVGAREAILVGHSLGTKIVREACRQSREGVIGLVFVDGSLNIGNAEEQREKARDAVRSVGHRAFAQRMFKEMFVEGSDQKLIDGIVARSVDVDPQYAEDLYVEAGAWDSERGLQQLHDVDVPTLVIQSSYYNINLRRVPLKKGMMTPLMEAVAREIKDSEVKVVEGVGHFTMLEAPAEVNREIAAFARRLSENVSA